MRTRTISVFISFVSSVSSLDPNISKSLKNIFHELIASNFILYECRKLSIRPRWLTCFLCPTSPPILFFLLSFFSGKSSYSPVTRKEYYFYSLQKAAFPLLGQKSCCVQSDFWWVAESLEVLMLNEHHPLIYGTFPENPSPKIHHSDSSEKNSTNTSILQYPLFRLHRWC